VTPVESLTAVFREQTGAHFLPPLTSAPVYRPDMSGGADRCLSTLIYSFSCLRIQFILPSLSSSLFAPSSGSYTRILVTSKYIRSSRTSVPVAMGSSISTPTKQRGNSENVRSTQLNESIERFLNCLDIYIGLPRCWYNALLSYVQTRNVNPYSCSSTLSL
jgi:hypothetical protein